MGKLATVPPKRDEFLTARRPGDRRRRMPAIFSGTTMFGLGGGSHIGPLNCHHAFRRFSFARSFGVAWKSLSLRMPCQLVLALQQCIQIHHKLSTSTSAQGIVWCAELNHHAVTASEKLPLYLSTLALTKLASVRLLRSGRAAAQRPHRLESASLLSLPSYYVPCDSPEDPSGLPKPVKPSSGQCQSPNPPSANTVKTGFQAD